VAAVWRTIRFGLSGAIMIALGRLAATGRLPRNIVAGIRLPSTLRSDEAWAAGHRAAASALTVAGCGPVAAAVIAALRRPDPDAQTTLRRLGSGWLLAWIAVATFQANKAARETGAAVTAPEGPVGSPGPVL
jgi:hypothetical protein